MQYFSPSAPVMATVELTDKLQGDKYEPTISSPHVEGLSTIPALGSDN